MLEKKVAQEIGKLERAIKELVKFYWRNCTQFAVIMSS